MCGEIQLKRNNGESLSVQKRYTNRLSLVTMRV